MAGQWTIFDSADALAGIRRASRLRGLVVQLRALPADAAIERIRLVAAIRQELGNAAGTGYIMEPIKPAENAAVTEALVERIPADYVNPYANTAHKLSVYAGYKAGGKHTVFAAVHGSSAAYSVMKIPNMRRVGASGVFPVKDDTAAIAAAMSVPGLVICKDGGKFVAYFQMIADEKAAQAAVFAAKESQGGSVEPIRAAVAPMLDAALVRAEASERAYAKRTIDAVAAADGDLNAAFQLSEASRGTDEYKMRERAMREARIFFTEDSARMAALGMRRFSRDAPAYVKPHRPGVDKLVASALAGVKANYEAYIRKLADKIGPVLDASAVGSDAWSSSVLTVKTVDGNTEKWQTKVIINRSVLGTLFNQWPTRKLK